MQSSMQNNQVNSNSVQSPNGSATYDLTGGTKPEEGSKKYKILIVEDENDAREVFVQLLETNPEYDVSSAADGQDALAKAEAESGGFDLILLDIVMPRLDGVDTLRKIRAEKDKYGDPIVVMLTNLGGEVAIDTAMKLGAQGYLMKIEVEPVQLLEKIAEFLKNKDSMPAAVTEEAPAAEAVPEKSKIIPLNPEKPAEEMPKAA